jgi:hypothetical protein
MKPAVVDPDANQQGPRETESETYPKYACVPKTQLKSQNEHPQLSFFANPARQKIHGISNLLFSHFSVKTGTPLVQQSNKHHGNCSG